MCVCLGVCHQILDLYAGRGPQVADKQPPSSPRKADTIESTSKSGPVESARKDGSVESARKDTSAESARKENVVESTRKASSVENPRKSGSAESPSRKAGRIASKQPQSSPLSSLSSMSVSAL